jgi:hypothetical protein
MPKKNLTPTTQMSLPQGGEGSKINSPLAPLGERGRLQHAVVKYYAGHHASTAQANGLGEQMVCGEHMVCRPEP